LFGDEVILSGVRHPSREEVVFRALSVVSRRVGVTDAAIPGSVAKAEHMLVQGSLGQRVAVLGFRAPELWRRPEGLAVFAPR
jgi:hypothetical protein